MNEMEKRQKLVDILNDMNEDAMVELHNNYCEANNYTDDFIYSEYELDEFLEGRTPTDILCMSFYGNFSPRHGFFWFNGYGNLESADYISQMPISVDELADYILSYEDALGNYDVQDLLNDEDDDEDDEDGNFTKGESAAKKEGKDNE